MEYEKIKQIMEDMGNSKLSAMDIEFTDGTKISMKKNLEEKVNTTTNVVVEQKEVIPSQIVAKEEKEVKKEGKIITSPMVGTFYLKPSPTEEPFVSVGQSIRKGDTVCIIEAMKLMNEIESEFDGVIAEVYLNDGEAVEYGSKLFRVE